VPRAGGAVRAPLPFGAADDRLESFEPRANRPPCLAFPAPRALDAAL